MYHDHQQQKEQPILPLIIKAITAAIKAQASMDSKVEKQEEKNKFCQAVMKSHVGFVTQKVYSNWLQVQDQAK